MSDDLEKGMIPSKFCRPYLTVGHQADSPGTTGVRGVTAVPDAPQIEGRDFNRGYLTAGHADPSPDDMPGANNPHYAAASAAYAGNRSAEQMEHLMPSQHNSAVPALMRATMVPADMRASAVPNSITVAATMAAPGESR